MIKIARLAQGGYWKYLTDGVAESASAPEQGSALTAYYAATGTPPGRWTGAGLAALGLAEGDLVTDEQLSHMLDEVAHPLTGEPVGGTPPRPKDQPNRKGKKAKQSGAVAGFDFAFSHWKSISVAWALADEGTKALIYECHQRAIADTLRYAEEHYLRSRSGKGGVALEEIEGVVAASFTHYDNRNHEPHLHQHVVLRNRAKSVSDGKWRTLDSRGLYKANQALSTLHANIMATYLTEALGWGWDTTQTRKGMEKAEVAGVPERLVAEFSKRTKAVEDLREELIEAFRATYGRDPTATEFDTINRKASERTKAKKTHKSLQELTEDWRERAEPYVGEPLSWVSTLAGRNDLPALRATDLSDEMLAEVAQVARRRVSERRSTYSRAHVETQVSIELFGVRFASVDDLLAVTRKATDMALGQSLQVSVNDLHHVPARWESKDGASKFRPVAARLYTTEDLLQAEARIFTLAERHNQSLAVGKGTVALVCDRQLANGGRLGLDQALAVEQVATSGRVLDVLVGPAGTGKTTTLSALRAAWEAEHGAGSVVGLAPSAAAAEVLAEELGIATENTAKWLWEGDKDLERRTELAALRAQLAGATATTAPPTASGLARRAERLADEIERWSFKPRQLVIVDEASLAGTFQLDKLIARAAEAGATDPR
jgi:conjugative relaxase-like TrwC/TraI family protein